MKMYNSSSGLAGQLPGRHTQHVGSAEASGESLLGANNSEQQKKQALLDMIDHGLQEYRASAMYDEMSIDDARSMVESL